MVSRKCLQPNGNVPYQPEANEFCNLCATFQAAGTQEKGSTIFQQFVALSFGRFFAAPDLLRYKKPRRRDSLVRSTTTRRNREEAREKWAL